MYIDELDTIKNIENNSNTIVENTYNTIENNNIVDTNREDIKYENTWEYFYKHNNITDYSSYYDDEYMDKYYNGSVFDFDLDINLGDGMDVDLDLDADVDMAFSLSLGLGILMLIGLLVLFFTCRSFNNKIECEIGNCKTLRKAMKCIK